MKAKISSHFKFRASQRNLSMEAIAYITTYGQCYHKSGAKIFFLRDRDIPIWDQAIDQWAKLAGTAVILTKDGRTLVTAWRNRQKGLKQIKHKPDFSSPLQRNANWR